MGPYTIQLFVLAISQVVIVLMQYNKIKRLEKDVELLTEANESRIANYKPQIPKPPIIELWEYKEPKELVKFLKDSQTINVRIIATGGGGSKYWIVYELYEMMYL
jgi:hypothetical protein